MEINQCPRCKTRFRGEMTVCPVDGESLQRMQDPLLGRTIGGRYLIEERIGGGGMGVVYRARHQVIARDVAIKFLHGAATRDPTSRQRFLGEARAANQINHENIIDITDFGETDDGLVYLVMEYLHGRSLDLAIAGRPMPLVRALHIAAQTAAGLARAHELDVIHRDVKPGNVFLTRRRGDPDHVKLLDFGIARFERELRITDRGTLLGTPEYIAPETVRSGEVGPLTDLYALGCVLYEMLVGQPPFMGNMTEVLVKQMREQPIPPSRLAPGSPLELDALLMKMLHKDPNQRHRDAYHLVDELRSQLERVRGSAPNDNKATVPIDPRLPPASADAAISSNDSARPTMHMPIERDEWAERVASYRQTLSKLHGDGRVPNEVRESMAKMESIVAEMALLRRDLRGSAEQLTLSEDELRLTRLRIGRALDELASDESKLARSIEAVQDDQAGATERIMQSVRALLARPEIGAVALRRGQLLSDDDALLLQGLAMTIENVREAQRQVGLVEHAVEQKRGNLEDVRFQMAQLKGRLAGLNANSDQTQRQVHERVQGAETRLREELERLVFEAERVAMYLRSQPEVSSSRPPKPKTA
jgi:serine/threonine protein kinase